MKLVCAQRACRASILLLLALPAVGRGEEPAFSPATHGAGRLQYLAGVPVATLVGTPAEIGQQHAALLGKPAVPLLKFGKTLMAELGMESYWPVAVMLSKRLMAQAPQRYRDEMTAAVSESQFDGAELEVANTLLELRRIGCSTLIVEGERSVSGGPLFGRNFDFPSLGLLDKYSLVTVVRPTDRNAFAAVGYPGLVGVLSGMNEHGLVVATLDVEESGDQSPKFEPTGVPLLLVFRQILEECATVDEAEQLLRKTQATTWANLAVCDRDRGAVFEITPKTLARRDAQESLVSCTNHFRSSDLATDATCSRYDILSSAADHTKLDVAAVHDHLHRANQGEATLQTMIFEPRTLTLHVAFGSSPSSALPLQRLELRPLLQGVANSITD